MEHLSDGPGGEELEGQPACPSPPAGTARMQQNFPRCPLRLVLGCTVRDPVQHDYEALKTSVCVTCNLTRDCWQEEHVQSRAARGEGAGASVTYRCLHAPFRLRRTRSLEAEVPTR